MKFQQEFKVQEPAAAVWAFFERPEDVALCMPGVESIRSLDPDTFLVQVTQRVGPFSATFESRVQVREKVSGERIAFSATGKAIRGALGNFRAESLVTLDPQEGATLVRVETEAALAGMLGSVGQRVIAAHAAKLTAEFARNLEQRMAPGAGDPEAQAPHAAPAMQQGHGTAARSATPPPLPAAAAAHILLGNGWAKAATALGALNAVIGIAILLSLP